jgi:hypothetical protein
MDKGVVKVELPTGYWEISAVTIISGFGNQGVKLSLFR